MASKLAYAGAEHRHEAQKPQALAPGEFPTWSRLPEEQRHRRGPAEDSPRAQGPRHEAHYGQARDRDVDGPEELTEDRPGDGHEDHGQADHGQAP